MSNDEKKVRWNRAAVVTRAGDLVDREGLGALTLTRLAEDLGIRPPSLFNHVDSLAGLVRDIAADAVEQLVGRLEAALDLPHTPAQGLLTLMETYRAYVRQHPGRYAATLAIPATVASRDPGLASGETRFMAAGLGLAREFGLTGTDAVHALRGWRALAHGFSSLEQNRAFGIPLDGDESFRRAVEALTPAPGAEAST